MMSKRGHTKGDISGSKKLHFHCSLVVATLTVKLIDVCKWIVLKDEKTSFKYTPVVASDYRTCFKHHTKSFVTRNISVATNIQTRWQRSHSNRWCKVEAIEGAYPMLSFFLEVGVIWVEIYLINFTRHLQQFVVSRFVRICSLVLAIHSTNEMLDNFSINGTVGLAHAGEHDEAMAFVLLNNVQTLCLPFPVKGEHLLISLLWSSHVYEISGTVIFYIIYIIFEFLRKWCKL